MAHAFITWDAALGRRMCPLATFGSRAPVERTARLVCVDPPRADRATLANADDVRGAIALVVRGGCSFLEKARRIQRAGAVAMILANNTREAPFEMFTMAADASDAPDAGDDAVSMPCVMMCLYDVRELFKQYPPSVKTGLLTLEIAATPGREAELVAECEAARALVMQQQPALGATPDESGGGGGWGAALKRTTSSLIKRWEAPVGSPRSVAVASSTAVTDPATTASVSEAASTPAPRGAAVAVASEPKPKPPLFAFVQWATSASEFVLFFAPLSDFCLVANNAVYEGRRVVCDPLLAHEDTLHNARELVDAIALVQRGACTFPAKLERIQRCGAAAAIVGNDDAAQEDAAFVMSVDHIKVDHVTIPAVMVSRRVFAQLVESDRPAQLRILCLSGEAAAACLARAGGQPISTHAFAVDDDDDDQGDATEPSALARLHAACRAGDHGACQRVLDETCEDERARRELVMARDQWQRTALHHACAPSETAGREHVVALLLRLGAQADARDVALNAALHFACLRGHAASVRALLAASPLQGQELAAARNVGGATPIHYAAAAGSTACLELLLSASARRVDERSDAYCFDGVDARDVDGATPLHVACDAAHVDCVLYLVAANADLAARDTAGRTPLEVACARVNEPARSLQALHIVEKLMAAGAPVVVATDDADADQQHETLAIDAIGSKAIKRELEIAFLRREARESRVRFRALTQQLDAQSERVGALAEALEAACARHEAAQRVAGERERRLERQQKQIEQLQLQMKMLLTVLHSNASGSGSTPTSDRTALLLSTHELVHAAAPSPSTMDDDDDDDVAALATEAARAQDAALARDLGKKCCRARQFALAQTYFERSLEVYALPGVARLLAETKALRREAEAARSKTSQTQPGRDGGAKRATDASDHDDARRLRVAVTAMEASPRTKDALVREIAKLEAMDQRASDYGATLKWIEWLLALPWSDSDDGRGGVDGLLALEASMFDEIERMESERRGRRERAAARLIQRTFREKYAVHLLRRAMASARIQRVYQERRRQREQQRLAALAVTRHRQRGAVAEAASLALPREAEEEEEEEDERGEDENTEDFDASTTLDPRAGRVCQRRRTRVVRGERVATDAQFTVLQLLATDPVRSRSHNQEDHDSEATAFHVWKRWGATRDDARQSTLSGPYEDAETATTRYERVLRESHATGTTPPSDQETTTTASKDPALPADVAPSVASAWTWLRASAS